MTSEETDVVILRTLSLMGGFLSSLLFHGFLLLPLPQVATGVSVSNATLYTGSNK